KKGQTNMNTNAYQIGNAVKNEYESFVNGDENKFSIVIIPDSQSYLDFRSQKAVFYPINQYEIYYRQMEFIKNNSVKNGGDFSFAIHVGDHVDHRSWNMKEWRRAAEALDIINNEIPFLTVIGNHDYDRWAKGGSPTGTKLYNKYFGPETEFYKDKDWFGGSTSNGANMYAYFTACNKKFLVIGLELDPTQKDIDWATEVINNNKGLPTIVVTHSYLRGSKEADNKTQNKLATAYADLKEHKFSAKEVWDSFITVNDQIFLIICGHVSKEGLRIDTNDSGNKTFAIMADYQDENQYLDYIGIKKKNVHYCGDGWLKTLNFDFNENKIYVKTWSTEFNRYKTDDGAELTLDIDWDWDERFTAE
ncbi:MAG: metallophosphoesterase, partial [Methanobrevibacter sp.]|nr:metallophosphoesterase [Methanobrevibacter sp.]